MHRRAAALAAVLALVAGGGVATARSAAPPVPDTTRPVADAQVVPTRLQRSDLRSVASLAQAYRSVLATRLSQSSEGIFVYGGRAEAVPVPDLDGDRGDDVLELRGNAAKSPAVAVRSGRTGRERWSVAADGLAAAQYVPVPGGRPLVLTYALTDEGQDAFLAYTGTTTLVVEAHDAATGAVAWTTSRSGLVSFTPASAAVAGLAYPGGVLATKPGGHPTLLVDSYDAVYTDAGESVRGSAEYVDVVTGESVGTTDMSDGDVSFCPVGDLDGDGTDDVAEVTAGGSVSALSGADPQQQLWTVQRSDAFDVGWADPSPDLTGDRRPDLLLGTMSYDAENGTIAALDGRTGKELWQRAGNGVARSVGDIDHDGRSDTRLVSYLGSAIRYAVVTGRGRTLWTTTVSNPVRNTGMLSWLAGDLDGDGIQDSYVRLVERSAGTSDGKGSFVVDGRTGRLAAHPDLGIPIGAGLDGRGDDLARTATVLSDGAQRVVLTLVDGRTARARWRREVPVASSADLVDVWAGDFTGTGRADLLAVLAEPDRAVTVVQHGRTGRLTWSGDYATRGGMKPF